MEMMLAVRLVVMTFFGLMPFFLTLFVLASGLVALTVSLYRVGIKKNSAPV